MTAAPIAIRAENVSLSARGNPILDDVSFALPEGAFLALIGPNGAGKTTLLKALLGLARVGSGQLSVFGKPAGQEPVGYVPQLRTQDRSFPALAVDVVASGLAPDWPFRRRSERMAKALEALARVGGTSWADRPIDRLSGGQMQRTLLARALAARRRFIVLDEPAAGLDITGETDLYKILEEHQRNLNATIVLVTHDWGVASHHASHVLVINRRVLAFGPSKDAMNPEVLAKAFGHAGHKHAIGWQPSTESCGHSHA